MLDNDANGPAPRPSHREVRRAALHVVLGWPSSRFIAEDVAAAVLEALALPATAWREDAVLHSMLSHALAELCDEEAVLRQLLEEQRREWLREHRPEASRRTTVWERIAPTSAITAALGSPPGEREAPSDELRGTLVSGALERDASDSSPSEPRANLADSGVGSRAADEMHHEGVGTHTAEDEPHPQGQLPGTAEGVSPTPVAARPEGEVRTAIRETAADAAMSLGNQSAQRLRRPRTPVAQLAASLRLRGLHVDTATVAAAWVALQATGRLLLAGPTGVGKTRLAQGLVQALPAPQHVSNELRVSVPSAAHSDEALNAHSGFLQQALRNYQDADAESLAWFLLYDDVDALAPPESARLEELLAALEAPCDARTSLRRCEWVAPGTCGVALPPNVYWIGTLNTDLVEVSRLSPRLLDRVFWVELEEPGVDAVLAPRCDEVVGCDVHLQAALLQALRGNEHWQRGRFVRPFEPGSETSASELKALPAAGQDCLDALERLQRLLRPLGGSLSGRAICEIAATLLAALETEAFAAVLAQDGVDDTTAAQAWLALDVAVSGKALPRLLAHWRGRNAREHRRDGLARVFAWALEPGTEALTTRAHDTPDMGLLAAPPYEALMPRTAACALREWQRTPPPRGG